MRTRPSIATSPVPTPAGRSCESSADPQRGGRDVAGAEGEPPAHPGLRDPGVAGGPPTVELGAGEAPAGADLLDRDRPPGGAASRHAELGGVGGRPLLFRGRTANPAGSERRPQPRGGGQRRTW